MKTLLSTTTLLLFIVTFNCYSQTISIADFIQLRGKNTDAMEAKLTSLNIRLYDQEETGNGKTHFTYQNATTTDKSSPFQWVDFVFEQDAQWNNRLSFQIQDIVQVTKYLIEIKNLGFVFTTKKIMDRQIYEVYTDGKNTIELITSQNRKIDDNNMYFNFAFYNSGEYEYAFARENKMYGLPQVNPNELYADLAGIPMVRP